MSLFRDLLGLGDRDSGERQNRPFLVDKSSLFLWIDVDSIILISKFPCLLYRIV